MKQRLAIHGGEKLWPEPFPMWPSLSEKGIQSAVEVLRSGRVNYWTGPLGMEFEKKWAEYNGARFAISTSNGTSALHTAVASLGIGPGDEVICPSYSFIASSFCILQAGALPVFADTGYDHVISATDIEKKITDRTKAVIVVHLYGIIADMDPIMEIARRLNLFVIEDCAQAHGGEYKGKKAGTVGHVGCFSFCQSKHFTTGGEGGAVITDDEDLAWRCKSFRDHGYDVQERMNLLELEAKLMYIHSRVGFNYRMTEVQSALGLAELERFDSWNLPARRRNGRMIIKGLGNHPIVLHTPPDSEERKNAFWWCPLVIDIDRLTCTAKEFVAAVNAEGVPAYSVQWPEMYKEEAYLMRKGFGAANYPFEDPKARRIDYGKVSCPTAHWLTDRTISFFAHPVYTEKHVELMIEAFNKVASAYVK
jgi:dTDP-4-amino-4,6-dideoxygalactose transaminase